MKELKPKIKMYKKEVPKLNKENFPTWKSLMKLHISRIGDTAWNNVEHAYVDPTGNLTAKQLKARKQHNQAMLEIAFSLSYSEYEDVNSCLNAHLMWDKLAKIYGGDTNINRAKARSLRGKFDCMRMLESENISQYCTRIKDVVNVIRGSTGIIDMKLL